MAAWRVYNMPSMKLQKKRAIPLDIFRMTMVIAICAFAVAVRMKKSIREVKASEIKGQY